ncbi:MULTISPECIES: ATP-binding protein [Cysteiniphilum]|uniref:ATPase AAA n=1 Tax=Cysteiniphilum litorale TaxID=2056700 RepID=A0A8J3E8R5_9GAMM|nr:MULTISPECIES: ATP-binding protein [Cysteiniphilum]WHN64947.1 ATP-binding protein [Cysteiniphilum sp. QT6929]GGG00938.1 ATPase AAA [Cysteiniphilum litorale]
MKKLPIGYSTLAEMINGNTFYVDKTKHIHEIASQGKYYFLSRPRRFGKSLTIDTLKQLFLGKHELFKGLYIEDKWDFNEVFPVIHFSFGGSKAINSEKTLLEIIDQTLLNTAKAYEIELPNLEYSAQFDVLIKALKHKYNQRVVFLVDEYDKPILDVISESDKALRNREILKGLYSVIKDNDACLRFVFLTGVSKFSKVSLFSGLNNLKDISFHYRYADLCGYTQEELESTFDDYLHDVDLGKLKAWYNGYNFAGSEKQKVYNPFDILLFFDNANQYQNYWFETGTPSFLLKIIEQQRAIIPDLENYEANLNIINSIDVDSIPIAGLMLQSGYLTIKDTIDYGGLLWYRLGYPNLEVRSSINQHFTKLGTTTEAANANQLAINRALLSDDWQQFAKAIQSFYSSIPYDYYSKTPLHRYEGYYCAIIYSYFAALGYDVKLEDHTSEGRIDMSIIITGKKVIIFEFKVSQGEDLAAKAVQQIIDKNYALKFTHLELPIYQVGISFDYNLRTINGFEVVEK